MSSFFSAEMIASSWYVGASSGTHVSSNGNTQIPSIAGKPPLASQPIFGAGYSLALNLGYQFDRPFRIDGEFIHHHLPMEKINNAIGPDTATFLTNSNTNLFSFLINGYYDFYIADHWLPYIGVGAGYARVNNKIIPQPAISVGSGLFFTKKEINYNAFAYQALLGIAYQLTKNFCLSLNYEYFSTAKTNVTGGTNLGPDSYRTTQRVSINTISFSVKYFFDV